MALLRVIRKMELLKTTWVYSNVAFEKILNCFGLKFFIAFAFKFNQK